MKATLRAMYLNDWIRIPCKFVFLFAVFKLGFDYEQYRTAFRWHRTQPRFCSFTEQSPTAPLIPIPYPYYSSWKDYQDIKSYYRLQNGMVRKWMNWQDRYFVYVDLPCRENVNSIDQLFLRGKQFSCSETIKFYLLGELVRDMGYRPKRRDLCRLASIGRFVSRKYLNQLRLLLLDSDFGYKLQIFK